MKKFTTTLFTALVLAFFISCDSKKEEETIPPAPNSVEQVSAALKNKSLKVEKTGQYGFAMSTEQPALEWIDTTVMKDNMTRNLVNELGNWSVAFNNDTACTIVSKGTNFTGTWSIDNKNDEEETPGIRLRIKYADPDFSFGNLSDSQVTYSYVVKGLDEKRILLELPRELNRRKLVSMLSIH